MRSEHLTSLRQELSILESGRVASEMGLENSSGQMVPSTLESGERIGLMAKESSFMLMETSTMDSGQMTRQTVMVFTST